MIKSFLTVSTLLLISPFAILSVEAQTIPSCRNINPRPNIVCYTEHPFDARQRDEGGTRTHRFIVERVAQDWVIIDYEVIKEGGFGAFSTPTGSILSSNGNASILDVTNNSIQRLNEVKSSLEASAQGCYPPVCAQVQGKLNAVNREIQNQSNFQQLAVQSGGNEKIAFTYTTSVSCNAFYCGGGASVYGKVKVYQRYLGNPYALQQRSESLSRSVFR